MNIRIHAITDEMCGRSDQFADLLGEHFEVHIMTNTQEITKHSYWCLYFVCSNLPRFSAMIVFYGHIIHDLFEVDAKTYLVHPSTIFFVLVSGAVLKDCYLFNDQKCGTQEHTGKVVGSNISNPCVSLAQRKKVHNAAG